MRRTCRGVAAACLLLSAHVAIVAANDLDRDEDVVFFPTAAAYDPSATEVTFVVHGWVFEPEEDSIRRRAALAGISRALQLGDDAATEALFVERGRRFLVDNESDQALVVRIGTHDVPLSKSQDDGHIRSLVLMSAVKFRRLTTIAGPAPTTIDYHLVTRRGDTRVFSGRVYLVSPEGWSIVSDIDDTIKDSNVLDKRELMKNTLLREFKPVAGMPEVYQGWQSEGAAFHYVSGSPWQLYPALAEFLTKQRLPGGSFQLRHFRLQDGSALELLGAPDAFKRGAIEQLLKNFPRRKFIFVGDTGERDPEVYGDLARRNPERVRLIALRNVTGEPIDGQRLQAALQGVPADRVILFDDPAQLPKLADLAE